MFRRIRTISLATLCLCSACAAGPDFSEPLRLPDLATSAPGPETATQHDSAAEVLYDRPDAEEADNRLLYYRGVRGALERIPHGVAEGDADEAYIELAFLNAPAADVARAIIREILQEPLTVAGDVSGTVTLTAASPVPGAEALAMLEAALAELNLGLIRQDTGFLLTSADRVAAASPQASFDAPIGFGVHYAPISYARPSSLAGLLAPLSSDRLTITPDDVRSMLILQGPQTEIASALEAIRTFDTLSLNDRYFGLFRLRYSKADAVQQELQDVMAATSDGEPIGEYIPLPRLNLLFVSTRTKESFDSATGWVRRLDRPSPGNARRLRHYVLENTPAETIAAQLNGVLDAGPLFSKGQEAGIAGQSAVAPGVPQVGAQGNTGPSVAVDELNNALIIRATDLEYEELSNLIRQMDVASPQVLIEATIAEITLNDELAYGVRWFFESGDTDISFSDNAAGSTSPIFPGFNLSLINSDVRVALNALSSVTRVAILSAPSIMVLNNGSARLQVGDEVPVVVQQAESIADPDARIVSTLQLRDTGVILEVEPRINASDIVVLTLTQEVSDVVETTTSGIDSPTIQQRRFTSTVAVQNNGTVALGGLIRETQADGETGVPILKDIPGLGGLFRARDRSVRRTELIIFLTPRIIRNGGDSVRALDELRKKLTNFEIAS